MDNNDLASEIQQFAQMVKGSAQTGVQSNSEGGSDNGNLVSEIQKFSDMVKNNQNNSQDYTQNDSKSSSWDNFVQLAEQTAQQRGFPVGVILGQAALESARGTASPGNNFFGIKGQGTAGSNNLATQEYGDNGYYNENSNFAAYNSPQDSINAYLDLVMSYPGVKEAMATGSPTAVLQAIENGGYATSPTYVQNVENTPEFQEFN